MITWKNKPLIPDHNRNADGEMIELGIEIHQIIELLDYWLIRHVGKIRATKQKLKIMRGEQDA